MSASAPGYPGSPGYQPGYQGPPAQAAPAPGTPGAARPRALGIDPDSDRLPEGFVFPGTERVNPFEVFSGPGYQAPRPRTDPVATAALVCALLPFLPGAGAVAAALGWWALRRLRRSWAAGESQAWMGVILGAAATAWWLWLLSIDILIGS